MKRLAAVLALALVPAAAAAQGNRCTKETLPVRGVPVSIGYCVAGQPARAPGSELLVSVNATFSAPGGSFTESPTFHFIAGEGPSRVIEDIDLTRIGSSGTLHLTLLFRGGVVQIESALLTPGAITIK